MTSHFVMLIVFGLVVLLIGNHTFEASEIFNAASEKERKIETRRFMHF